MKCIDLGQRESDETIETWHDNTVKRAILGFVKYKN